MKITNHPHHILNGRERIGGECGLEILKDLTTKSYFNGNKLTFENT